MKTVITDAGIRRIIQAGSNGPLVKVTSLRIGSSIIQPLSEMTDVTDFVWGGSTDYIKYSMDDSIFTYVITLDESVGNFEIGNIGLFLDDGTMFAITTLLKTESKIKKVGKKSGNVVTYEIPIKISGLNDLVDVTYLISTDSAVPSVAVDTDLPDYETSVFNLYVVQEIIDSGLPGIAIKTPNGWSYIDGTGGTDWQFFSNEFRYSTDVDTITLSGAPCTNPTKLLIFLEHTLLAPSYYTLDDDYQTIHFETAVEAGTRIDVRWFSNRKSDWKFYTKEMVIDKETTKIKIPYGSVNAKSNVLLSIEGTLLPPSEYRLNTEGTEIELLKETFDEARVDLRYFVNDSTAWYINYQEIEAQQTVTNYITLDGPACTKGNNMLILLEHTTIPPSHYVVSSDGKTVRFDEPVEAGTRIDVRWISG